jgi:hypothetical protein
MRRPLPDGKLGDASLAYETDDNATCADHRELTGASGSSRRNHGNGHLEINVSIEHALRVF